MKEHVWKSLEKFNLGEINFNFKRLCEMLPRKMQEYVMPDGSVLDRTRSVHGNTEGPPFPACLMSADAVMSIMWSGHLTILAAQSS